MSDLPSFRFELERQPARTGAGGVTRGASGARVPGVGDSSEDHTFSVTDFVAQVPAEVRAQNLGLSVEEAGQLPDAEVYFAQGPPPDDDSSTAEARPEPELTSAHRYPLLAQEPRRSPGGGIQRTVTVDEFPISANMAGSVLELEPGALRELHWHPNADEWQYYLEGQAQMGVFLSGGEAVTEEFEAGDVGYAPMGAGHYILNTGDDACRVLVGFNSGHYQAIDLSEWLSTNPQSTLAANLGVSTTPAEAPEGASLHRPAELAAAAARVPAPVALVGPMDPVPVQPATVAVLGVAAQALAARERGHERLQVGVGQLDRAEALRLRERDEIASGRPCLAITAASPLRTRSMTAAVFRRSSVTATSRTRPVGATSVDFGAPRATFGRGQPPHPGIASGARSVPDRSRNRPDSDLSRSEDGQCVGSRRASRGWQQNGEVLGGRRRCAG